MSKDSAHGKNRLPMVFYQTFWYLMKEYFTDVANCIFFEKRNKFCENSLFCIDYKTITKTIINRLLPILNEIISLEQLRAVPDVIYTTIFL